MNIKRVITSFPRGLMGVAPRLLSSWATLGVSVIFFVSILSALLSAVSISLNELLLFFRICVSPKSSIRILANLLNSSGVG